MEAEKILLKFLYDFHVGEDRAVTSKVLEKAFGVKGTEIRRMVNHLRSCGCPVCSGENGYYYAKTYAELDHTARQLWSRVTKIAKAAIGISMALPFYADCPQITLLELGSGESDG